ncbi:MAG: kelch repeat-containing protein [Actinomycetota bacterium]
MRYRALSLALFLLAMWAPSSAAPGARPFAWQRLARAPTARTEVAAALDGDGRIVVAGGFDDSSQTVPKVEIYDPDRDSWSAGPALPVAVDHVMGASLDGTVYVFGGFRADGSPNDQAFALQGSSWRQLPRMPEPRGAAGAAAAGGQIYIAGGIGPSGLATSTLIFDPSGGGSWSTAPGLHEPREHLGVASFGGRVYVLGGRAGGDLSDATEVFTPKNGSWRRLPDMPTPRGGVAAGSVDDGFIVVPGGEGSQSDDGTFPQVEAFDIEHERWLSLPPLPTPRHGLGVVGVGNVLYTLAGGPREGFAFSGAVEAIGLRGLDKLRCLGSRPTIVGTPGRDALTGSAERDVFAALGGPDLVRGGGGKDVLCGDSGNDSLVGGPGSDRLDGGPGRDRCVESGSRSRRACER